MNKMTIKDQLDNLSDNDTYSLVLFSLFQLQNIPEYSTMSELAYLLDKKSFLTLCQYFGGLTVKFPTIAEITDIVKGLTLYQKVNFDGETLLDAIHSLGYDNKTRDTERLKGIYLKISKVLENYNFKVTERYKDV